MFIRIHFMDRIARLLTESWTDSLMIGASLIMTALMIFIFPAILAYLIATLLLWIGLSVFYLSFKIRRLERESVRLHQEQWW